MARKEEIKQAAFNNDRESSKENQQYFIDGAEVSDDELYSYMDTVNFSVGDTLVLTIKRK